jgi:capsular polysaccharide biosynthesis protein
MKLMSLSKKMSRISQRIRRLDKIRPKMALVIYGWLRGKVKSVVQGEVQLEIDKSTVLPDMTVDELTSSDVPGQAIVVPEMYVDVKAHRLSVHSDNSAEKEFYIDHPFRAPEMILERLTNQYWFPEYGFLVSKDGKVWRHSVLGQYGDPHFLTTYAVQDRQNADGYTEYIFHEHLLHKAPIVDDAVLITSHYASHNYGHFMLDMVPLIQLGAKLGLKMVSRPMLDWQKPIYNRIGTNPDNVKIFSDRAVFLREVFVSNRHNAVSTYAASPNHRVVFEEILKNISDSNTDKNSHKRIYLSRGASKNREIRNRSTLGEMLQNEGFEVVRPETLSFDDQAIMLSQAEVVVSEFGALMVNVVFCKPGTKVIEIIPENKNDPWSVHLCASLNLEHVVLFHKVNDEDRESFEIAGRNHTDIYFKFDADIDLIKSVVSEI